MTRIVAGTAGGRRLAVPRSNACRPTSERAREALFSSLFTLVGELSGMRVADLYAGTGAVGFEALSRGAAYALLVESDRTAVRGITGNIRALRLPGADLAARPVETLVAAAPPDARPFDVVFLDPPYRLAARGVADVVAAAVANGWTRDGTVVVVERPTREDPFPWPGAVVPDRSRRYGEATLWYGHARPAGG